MKHFKVGFTGAALDEAVDTIGNLITHAKTIVVPFAGSGKYIAAFAREDRTIYSWDTQEVSNVLVQCLVQPWTTNIGAPKGVEGYARDDFPFSYLDEGSARLINYIGIRGSVHDRAALIKTITRCTVMGRLLQWAASIEGYQNVYDIFTRAKESLKYWAARPGKIIHTRGDYFLAKPPECDILYIDPPKVFGRTDVYSGKAYRSLNGVLEQKESPQPVWTIDTYMQRIMDTIGSTKWDTAILFHSSGIVPTIDELIQAIPVRDKTVIDFPHGNRIDYAIFLGNSNIK